MKRHYHIICNTVILGILVLTACAPAVPTASETPIIEDTPTLASPIIEPSSTPPPTSSPVPVATLWEPTKVPDYYLSDGALVGIMLGGDFEPTRPERNIYGVRSDVFVILVIDRLLNGQSIIHVFSIPRSLFVQVPCSATYDGTEFEGLDRINAAWAYGKFDCVRETVKATFDIDPDFMGYVDFDGFLEIADYFGGLDIQPGVTYTDWCGDYHGTDGYGTWVTWRDDTTYHMANEQLLCYVRARHNARFGDLDRNRRMLEIVQAMAFQWPQQVLGGGISSIPVQALRMYALLKEYGQWDFKITDFIRYAPLALEIKGAIWNKFRITYDQSHGIIAEPTGANVIVPDIRLDTWFRCMVDGFGAELCTEEYAL